MPSRTSRTSARRTVRRALAGAVAETTAPAAVEAEDAVETETAVKAEVAVKAEKLPAQRPAVRDAGPQPGPKRIWLRLLVFGICTALLGGASAWFARNAADLRGTASASNAAL